MQKYDRTKLCAHLRSKNMYTHSDPAHVEHSTTSLTEIFWCNLTMNHCGPDELLCDSQTCCQGRWCFRDVMDV